MLHIFFLFTVFRRRFFLGIFLLAAKFYFSDPCSRYPLNHHHLPFYNSFFLNHNVSSEIRSNCLYPFTVWIEATLFESNGCKYFVVYFILATEHFMHCIAVKQTFNFPNEDKLPKIFIVSSELKQFPRQSRSGNCLRGYHTLLRWSSHLVEAR